MVIDRPTTPTDVPHPNAPASGGQEPVTTHFPTMRVSFAAGMDAVEAPRLPKDFGSGYFQGAQALAQGMQHVAGFLENVGLQQAKAKSLEDINSAEVAMSKAHGDFAAWMEQNKQNPDSWLPEWNKRTQDIQKSLVTDQTSQFAKEQIMKSFNTFSTQVAVNTQVSGLKQQFSNTRDAGVANAMTMMQAGNYGGASAKIDDLAANGFIHATEAAQMKQSIIAKHENDMMDSFKSVMSQATPDNGGFDIAKGIIKKGIDDGVWHKEKGDFLMTTVESKQRSDGLLAQIGSNPVETLRQLEEHDENGKPKNFDWLQPGDRSTMLSHARAATMQVSRTEQDNFLAGLETGAIKDEDAARKFFSDATPTHIKEMLVNRWKGGLPDTKEAFMQAQGQVLGFDPKAPDAKYQEAALRSTIKTTLQPESAKVLNEMLDDRIKEPKPQHEVRKFVNDAIMELHKNQLLGVRYKDQDAAIQAVHDPKVLEAFGIKPETGIFFKDKDAVLKTDGPASLDLFRKEVAKNTIKGKSPLVPDKFNALPKETQDLVTRLLHSSSAMDEDTNLRIQSMSNGARLNTEFEAWLSAHPDATVSDANKWLTEVQGRFSVQSASQLLRPKASTGSVYPMGAATPAQLKDLLKKYGN